MAKFDIYTTSSSSAPFLIELQDDILDMLSTRVVAPLIPAEGVWKRMKILNPIIQVKGADHVLMTHLLAAVQSSTLGEKVDSALSQRDEIIASLDFLFTGV